MGTALGVAGWALAGLLIAIGEARRLDEAAIYRGAHAAGRAYERRLQAKAAGTQDDDERLADYGGCYPRIESPAADDAAPTPSRR